MITQEVELVEEALYRNAYIYQAGSIAYLDY